MISTALVQLREAWGELVAHNSGSPVIPMSAPVHAAIVLLVCMCARGPCGCIVRESYEVSIHPPGLDSVAVYLFQYVDPVLDVSLRNFARNEARE